MASPHRLPPPKKGDIFAGAVFEQVIGEVGHGKGKQALWRLRCSCGAVIEKKASYIRSLVRGGWKAKCENYQVNHSKIKIGQKYNRLTVRKLTREYVLNKKTNKEIPYLFAYCDCECGKKNIRGNARGLTNFNKQIGGPNWQSCGCQKIEKNLSRKLPFSGTKEKELWNNAKKRAKQKKLPFNIDIEDIVIPEICPVLGIPIKVNIGGDRMSDNSPTLDKFIPSKGYVKGNVQIISWRANNLKNDGSPEEWIKIANWCQQETIKKKLKE